MNYRMHIELLPVRGEKKTFRVIVQVCHSKNEIKLLVFDNFICLSSFHCLFFCVFFHIFFFFNLCINIRMHNKKGIRL